MAKLTCLSHSVLPITMMLTMYGVSIGFGNLEETRWHSQVKSRAVIAALAKFPCCSEFERSAYMNVEKKVNSPSTYLDRLFYSLCLFRLCTELQSVFILFQGCVNFGATGQELILSSASLWIGSQNFPPSALCSHPCPNVFIHFCWDCLTIDKIFGLYYDIESFCVILKTPS